MVLLVWAGINASDAKPKQMKSPGVQQIPQGQMLGLDARNIGLFRDLGTMPMYIGVLELVEVGDQAKWCKSCHNKFNTTELKRTEKWKCSKISNDRSLKKVTRERCAIVTEISRNVCFFCDIGEEAGYLREAPTFQLDQRMRE